MFMEHLLHIASFQMFLFVISLNLYNNSVTDVETASSS